MHALATRTTYAPRETITIGLGPEWRTLPARRGRDRLVAGPPGVFELAMLPVQADFWVHGDALQVGRTRTTFIPEVRRNSHWAARSLSAAAGFLVPVTGVIAVSGTLTVAAEPHGVHVLHARDLDAWLHSGPPRLSFDQVEAVYDVAHRPSTWA